MRWMWLVLLATACGTPDVSQADDATDATQDVSPGTPSPVTFVLHKDQGTYDVLRDGKPLFLGVTADVSYRDATGASHVLSMRGPCTHDSAASIPGNGPDTLTCLGDGLLVTLTLSAPANATHLQAAMTVANQRAELVTIDKMTPLLMQTADGASLQLPSDPKDVRILENGRFVVLDVAVMLAHGDDERPGLADMLPLDLRGGLGATQTNAAAATITMPTMRNVRLVASITLWPCTMRLSRLSALSSPRPLAAAAPSKAWGCCNSPASTAPLVVIELLQ